MAATQHHKLDPFAGPNESALIEGRVALEVLPQVKRATSWGGRRVPTTPVWMRVATIVALGIATGLGAIVLLRVLL
ncbi:MAG: hypothetical protein AAF658_07975 [Myxococcota bacterium]